jgi:hypothetical protein
MADETARTGGLDRERADGSHLKKSGVHSTRTLRHGPSATSDTMTYDGGGGMVLR